MGDTAPTMLPLQDHCDDMLDFNLGHFSVVQIGSESKGQPERLTGTQVHLRGIQSWIKYLQRCPGRGSAPTTITDLSPWLIDIQVSDRGGPCSYLLLL